MSQCSAHARALVQHCVYMRGVARDAAQACSRVHGNIMSCSCHLFACPTPASLALAWALIRSGSTPNAPLGIHSLSEAHMQGGLRTEAHDNLAATKPHAAACLSPARAHMHLSASKLLGPVRMHARSTCTPSVRSQ
eukprot:4049382-Pleurochrysis_carterae.AAC.3